MPVNKLSNLFKSFSNLSLYVGYDNKCLCISLRILGNFIQLIDTIWKTWNFDEFTWYLRRNCSNNSNLSESIQHGLSVILCKFEDYRSRASHKNILWKAWIFLKNHFPLKMIPHCDSFLPLYELKNLWIWNSADMTKLENMEFFSQFEVGRSDACLKSFEKKLWNVLRWSACSKTCHFR